MCVLNFQSFYLSLNPSLRGIYLEKSNKPKNPKQKIHIHSYLQIFPIFSFVWNIRPLHGLTVLSIQLIA